MKLFVDEKESNIFVEAADTLVKRLVGLIGKPAGWNRALLIKPCNSIHMFFMSFAIDAVFLDKDNKVIKVIENLKPWQISPIVKHSAGVLELPAGKCSNLGIKAGANLTFNKIN